MRRKALILGKIVLTTVIQGFGAPIVDPCSGVTKEGKSWNGYAIHLKPWKKEPVRR